MAVVRVARFPSGRGSRAGWCDMVGVCPLGLQIALHLGLCLGVVVPRVLFWWSASFLWRVCQWDGSCGLRVVCVGVSWCQSRQCVVRTVPLVSAPSLSHPFIFCRPLAVTFLFLSSFPGAAVVGWCVRRGHVCSPCLLVSSLEPPADGPGTVRVGGPARRLAERPPTGAGTWQTRGRSRRERGGHESGARARCEGLFPSLPVFRACPRQPAMELAQGKEGAPDEVRGERRVPRGVTEFGGGNRSQAAMRGAGAARAGWPLVWKQR